MHLINIEKGVLGTSAVVGTTIANAAGYAYAVKCRGSGALVVSFFGDGATEEGVFAETLNFAALKALPIIFVCENNQYAIHTHQSRRQGVPQICERARSLGVTAERVEHSDVLYLHERVRAVSPSVRAGRPYFFEVMTYRWREHVGPDTDYQLGYRTEDEAASWLSADQLTRMANLVQPLQRSRIQQEVDEEIAEAFAFAEASPVPEAAELYTDVFKES
jgi:TPP-dependent pyruvate/acetoin dehydrogenase alpha subunit